MLRKIIFSFGLGLLVFSLTGAADPQHRIDAARGRKKLDLILSFLQSRGQAAPEAEERQLLERRSREALALSREFADRHAQGLALKYAAFLASWRQEYDPALADYFQARRIFGELGDDRELGALDREIAGLFAIVVSVFSDYGRTIEHYRRSLALSRAGGDRAAIAKNLYNVANAYRARGDFQEAIPIYKEALQLNELTNNLYDIGDILTNLGEAHLKTGDLASAMDCLQQALTFYEKKRQNQGRGRRDSLKALAYLQQNNLPLALGYFQKALASHSKYEEKSRTAQELQNLSRLYELLGQESKARESVQQALELRQQLDDQIEILGTLLAHAAALQNRNDLVRAEALLRYCESRAMQKHLQGKLCETYLQLSSLFARRRDPATALYYRSLGKKTPDGLPSTTILAGMQHLIATHESGKEIDKIKGQKRRLTIIGMLAIGLLLVLIGVLAWKQKSIRKWVRDLLSNKDQQLQKKMTQLQELGRKLDRLQETPSPGACAPSATGNGPSRECLQLVLRKMQDDKIFLDSELTLKKMAAKVGANTSSLSKMLNQDLGMGFSDFVNYFRVEEAKKIIRGDENNQWDMTDICFEVGFNSMSSFYRIFKAHAGTTPMEFQRSCGKKDPAF